MDSFQIRFIHSSEHPLATPTFLSTFPLQFYEICLSVPLGTWANLGPSDTARGITRAHEVVRRSGFAWIYLHVGAHPFLHKSSASPLTRPRSAKGGLGNRPTLRSSLRADSHTPLPLVISFPFFLPFFPFPLFPPPLSSFSPFYPFLPLISLSPTDTYHIHTPNFT